MESNVLCVIHSMNNTNKVSKVCLWNSMLHSPVSAADVMIVVHLVYKYNEEPNYNKAI